MQGEPHDWGRGENRGARGLPRQLYAPLRVAVPVLIAVAAIAAYMAAVDDDVTSLETEALQSSTLPKSESDPGQPDLAPGAESDGTPALGVESLRSPSTLRIGGQAGSISETISETTIEDPDGTTVTSTESSVTASTAPPTTGAPTTGAPTTRAPTTDKPSTAPPSTAAPTTRTSTTAAPTTRQPTTRPPTTRRPTTRPPTTPATPCSGNDRFERVFRDDFNGSAISSNWRQYHSIGNNEYGLRRPAANTVSNGRLFITAQMIDGKLVSGGMAHNYDQLYGKYVVKVRTDQDPDLATSGVVLTWPESQVHPRDGENNIYESLTYDADRSPFYTVVHKPFGSHSDHVIRVHNADGTKFQIMTMEWTPEGITIIREGPGGANAVDRWTLAETSEDLIPDVPHHVTIQLDAWKQSMSSVVRMEVDYIEVYKYCG